MTEHGIRTINNKKEEKMLRHKVADFDFQKTPKKDIQELLEKMRGAMCKADGIGLSANQIGLDSNVFIARAEGKFYAIFNPKLTKMSEEPSAMEEGCLSVPEVFGTVVRPAKVTLEGFDKNGKPLKIKAWGLLARIFQHEIDHLNGTLFIDKAKDLHRYQQTEKHKNIKTAFYVFNMKFIFFGGAESKFAQIILDELKKAGWQPMAEIRDAKAQINLDYLKSLNADFFLVAAFAKILKKEVLNISPIGPISPIRSIPVIGIHPSLLPRWRGPSPIQSAILSGETETGTTIFLIDEKIDHGSVISQKSLVISHQDNYESLEKKLAELSADLILKTLPKYLKGEIMPQPQDETKATYTKKFTAQDAQVDLKKDDPKAIWLKTRALNPEPGVYTELSLKNNKKLRLKILEADFENSKLIIQKIQPAGKRVMTYQEFLNGYQKLLI